MTEGTSLYEMMAIIDPELGEEATSKQIDKVKGFITDLGGKMTHEDIWGVKELSYRIRNNERGYYIVLNFELAPDKLEELKRIKPVIIDYSSLDDKKVDLQNVKDTIKIEQTEMANLENLENLVGNNNLKGQIIKTQIPLLNKEINYFLELFSLLDYHFIIDENFKERIVTRDEDSEFQSLSNGQKARISFSIMFAFLKLIEERNGIKVNILILDEILDSSVDASGREELLNILKSEFSEIKDILIISHNDQIKEKVELFNRLVSIEREKFSEMTFEEMK